MLKIYFNIPHVKLQFATKFEMNLTNSSYFSELPKGWYYVIKQWQCSPKAQSVSKVKGKDIDDCALIIGCCLEATITLNHKASINFLPMLSTSPF